MKSLMFSVLALALGCSVSHPKSSKGSIDEAIFQAHSTKPIGLATMKADGTIVLDLRAEIPGGIGHAEFIYPPNHPEYNSVIKHIGPIKPGEEKLVPPWPAE